MAYDDNYYYGRPNSPSIFDGFTLSPLPYPVLFILLMVLLLLGFSWSSSYEDFLESAQEQMSWALFATPVVLLILIRCISSFQETLDGFAGPYSNPFNRRRRSYLWGSSEEGSSPWGVAALLVLLLLLVSYHSSIKDLWRP